MVYSNPFDNKEYENYTTKTFGEAVRQRRMQLKMSVRQMASLIEMTPSYLSEIEIGVRVAPSGVNSGKDYLKIIADNLDLTEDQRKTYLLMAQVSRLTERDILGKYFMNNPSALKFVLKAFEQDFTNAEWENLFQLIFRQK